MRILLFTRSLDIGGAERQLVLLAKSLNKLGIPVAVMVYYSGGFFQKELSESGITILDLRKRGRWDLLRFSIRTVRELRRYKPTVIYTYIGAHIVASILRPIIPRCSIVWSIRASNMKLQNYDWLSRVSEKISILLSRSADGIISNSNAGREYALSIGYKGHIHVVQNGIESDRFTYSEHKRRMKRRYWGIPDDVIVFGMMARLDIMKDHMNFLSAAKIIKKTFPEAHFVCVGSGDDQLLEKLKRKCVEFGIENTTHWPGYSADQSADYSAFDVFVQSSAFGEGFPNAIGEAMACGLPIVATDVGDCRNIVDNYGRIVPPGDSIALAEAMIDVIKDLPDWRRDRSRQRIIDLYSISAMVDKTYSILNSDVR